MFQTLGHNLKAGRHQSSANLLRLKNIMIEVEIFICCSKLFCDRKTKTCEYIRSNGRRFVCLHRRSSKKTKEIQNFQICALSIWEVWKSLTKEQSGVFHLQPIAWFIYFQNVCHKNSVKPYYVSKSIFEPNWK